MLKLPLRIGSIFLHQVQCRAILVWQSGRKRIVETQHIRIAVVKLLLVEVVGVAQE